MAAVYQLKIKYDQDKFSSECFFRRKTPGIPSGIRIRENQYNIESKKIV